MLCLSWDSPQPEMFGNTLSCDRVIERGLPSSSFHVQGILGYDGIGTIKRQHPWA